MLMLRRTLTLRWCLFLIMICGIVLWIGVLFTRCQNYNQLYRSHMSVAQRAAQNEQEIRQKIDRINKFICDDKKDISTIMSSSASEIEVRRLEVKLIENEIKLNKEYLSECIETAEKYARFRISREALARKYELAAKRPWISLRPDKVDD